ncbi:MAG: GNAT family N-acetyltransferase [Hyphomonas sp.]|uniref:GNAT family N-acetyltransferase n=1 Tax=Hyphomonas sp. TaxID=87 RepID=UPI003528DE94
MNSARHETQALEQNLWSQWAQFGVPDNCAFHREDGVWRLVTPIASLPYNGVFRFDVDDREADARIDRIIADYDARNVEHFWVVHPSSRPADLDKRLIARGFMEFEVCPGMVVKPKDLKADIPSSDGVEIREISATDETPILELVANRWSVPTDALGYLQSFFRENHVGQPDGTTRAWLATLNGRPVGKAFTHRSGNIAGLYGVAISPEARGHGVGLAICARALRETATDGIELLVLHSTPMAVDLYKKLGFRSVAPFRLFGRGEHFSI